ncbi:hypothetical protein [Hyalangium gracile]|uniref:hypothetical protein n=1 Tax=Hyalangium gracile TaxID=394092 RepID=UPI001CCAFDFD|nr:hypothetical protein [Hyalangium gracile]
MSCFHKTNPVFSFNPKKKARPFGDGKAAKGDDKDSDAKTSKEEVKATIDCPLCYALGFRSAWRETLLGSLASSTAPKASTAKGADTKASAANKKGAPVAPSKGPDLVVVDGASFEAGYKAFWDQSAKVTVERSLPWAPGAETKYTPSTNKTPLCFDIVKGQNGETYHGLIAALISPSVQVVIGTEGSPKAASAAQKEFLYYYLPHEQIVKDSKSAASSREECTRLIARFFKANLLVQDEIHASFRDYFSDRALSTAIKNPYVEVSYLSKFYINRFLTEANDNTKTKLPKASAVNLIALVFVRRGHEAGDARAMTPQNLAAILEGFKTANAAEAPKKGTATAADAKSEFKPSGKAITHVILFGDIGRLEVAKLQETYAPEKGGFTFIHLPSPFFEDPDVKSSASSQAMQAFRGVGIFGEKPDHAPTEAKMMAIFIALQERYGDKLFGVGFRSGTLDGAGFLGIPILYFDDTTSKTAKEFARYADGKYLVSLASDTTSTDEKEPTFERILELTRAVNTFIRINNEPIKDSTGKVIVLNDKARAHLVLALRLWIFTDTPNRSGPLWRKRVALLTTKDPRTVKYLQDLFAAYHVS